MENSKKNETPGDWIRAGKTLVHYCRDWDDMLICAEMSEITACSCDFYYESDNEARDNARDEMTMRILEGMAEAQTAEIHSPDFSAQAARPRLGNEMEENATAKPYIFPIIKERMTLSDAMSYLVNTAAVKGSLVFWPSGSEEPTFVNFGDLSRAEMVYALERAKNEELLSSFAEEGGIDE